MATIQNNIRWADNTAELKKNLMDGVNTLDVMKQSVDRVAGSMSGQGLFGKANAVAAAIEQMGGITKLTGSELDRVNGILDKAIAKYKAMGIDAPTAILSLRDATQKSSDSWKGFVDGFNPKQAISDPMGVASGAVQAFAGLLGPAGVAATGFVGVLTAASTAAYNLASQAAAVGAKLDDMHDKTGISVPGLSRLSQAAVVAGTDIGTLSQAVFTMDKNMANSPDKFEKGLEKIGINFKDFLALNPEDRLNAVSVGLAGVADSSERNAAGIDIMGKSYADLGPALMDLNRAMEMTAGISVWTEEDASNAEAFEMQIAALKLQFDDIAISLGRDLLPGALAFLDFVRAAKPVLLDMATSLFPTLAAAVKGQILGFGYVTTAIDLYNGTLNKLPDISDRAADKAQKLKDALYDKAHTPDKLVAAMLEPIKSLSLSMDELDAEWKKSTKTSDEAVAAAKRAAAAHKEVKYEVVGLGKEGEKFVEEYLKRSNAALAEQYKRLEAIIPAQKEWWNLLANPPVFPIGGIDIEGSVNQQTAATNKTTVDALTRQLGMTIGLMPDLGKKAGTAWTGGFSDILDDLPTLLQKAFLGGGGFEGFAKALGVQFGEEFATAMAPSMSKKAIAVWQAAGAAAGMIANATNDPETKKGQVTHFAARGAEIGTQIMPGYGTLVGAGVGALVGALKVNPQEIAARAEFGKLMKEGETLSQTIQRVADAYVAMGLSGEEALTDLRRALDATHTSAEEEAAAMKIITDKLAEGERKAKELEKGVEGVTDAFKAYSGPIPAALKQTIAKMLEIKGLTDAQRQSLQALLDSAAPNFQALTDKAAGFGITIEGLGPKFQQQQIEQRAKDITDFLQEATDAGADVGGMLAGLADEISQLVIDSKKFGTAIPENMKPFIDELARAGKLVDENGDAITDVTGIKFEATPLDQGLDKLTKAIEDLTKLLSGEGGVTDAIEKVGKAANDHIPQNPFRDWQIPDGVENWRWPAIPTDGSPAHAAHGGFVTPRGIAQGFAMGGIVQAFGMGGMVGSLIPNGTDTVPAVLTPGESVLTRHATALLGADNIRSLNSGRGIGGAPMGDRFVIVQPKGVSGEAVWNALPYDVKHNNRGLRTQFIEATTQPANRRRSV